MLTAALNEREKLGHCFTLFTWTYALQGYLSLVTVQDCSEATKLE